MTDARDATMAELNLIYRIRVAAGDPIGKLMQDELVQKIAALREAEATLRLIAGMTRKTREQRLASACIRFLDALEATP